MHVKFVFYKSSSKYYDPCCLKCEGFDNYINDKNTNTVVLSDDEIRTKITLIESVLGIVKSWSKTEYYIDEERIGLSEVESIVDLAKCENAKEHEVVGDHCFDINGWGCNSLSEIAFRDSGYSYYRRNKYFWYQIGNFSDGVYCMEGSGISSSFSSSQ